MSVDIEWDLITAGADGQALAENIRAFIHAKFQQITLPRFINSVHVHSFEFGSISPEIEIKDICDPLPDFYEDDEDDLEEVVTEGQSNHDLGDPLTSSNSIGPGVSITEKSHATDLRDHIRALQNQQRRTENSEIPMSGYGTTFAPSHNGPLSALETAFGPFPRSGTPGIPGGTSNMNYFHFPVGGLSGAQTPLVAVAGGHPFATQAWLHDQQAHHTGFSGAAHSSAEMHDRANDGTVSRPVTTGSISSPEPGSPMQPASPAARPVGYLSAEKVSDDLSSDLPTSHGAMPPPDQVSPSDLQVVARVTYDGDIRMTLTAEIFLDYPMPSFVNIPLKLCITGVTFDGVAILAYIKKKMHFCFLDPEDAKTLVGATAMDGENDLHISGNKKSTLGNLLQEIHVETEIGRQENGKQVLKNVGKVERFVLEQVRRIFEEEFVFPSFWTFLV